MHPWRCAETVFETYVARRYFHGALLHTWRGLRHSVGGRKMHSTAVGGRTAKNTKKTRPLLPSPGAPITPICFPVRAVCKHMLKSSVDSPKVMCNRSLKSKKYNWGILNTDSMKHLYLYSEIRRRSRGTKRTPVGVECRLVSRVSLSTFHGWCIESNAPHVPVCACCTRDRDLKAWQEIGEIFVKREPRQACAITNGNITVERG